MKFIFTLFLTTITLSLWSQNYYQNIYGDSLSNEKAITGYQCQDGRVIVVAVTNNGPLGSSDIITYQLDAQGNLLGKNVIYHGTVHQEYPNSLFYKDGVITIVGESTQLNPFNLNSFVLKIDTLNTFISFNTYGAPVQSEQFYDIVATHDGGFATAGFASLVGGNGNDYYLAKFDAAGNKEWEQFYDLGSNESGMTLVQTPDKGFIVSGDNLQPSGNYNVGLIKTDSIGNLIWTKTIRESYNGGCKNMFINSLNQLVIVGEMSTATTAAYDIYMARMTIDGDSIWAGHVPGTNLGEAGFDIYEKTPNSYLITGYSNNGGQTDIGLTEVDSMGNIILQTFYGSGGVAVDIGYTTIPSIWGGSYIIIGRTQVAGMGDQAIVIHDYFSAILSQKKVAIFDPKLQIMPNPVRNQMTIQFDLPETTKINMTIYNALGQQVQNVTTGTFEGTNTIQVNTQKLAAGVYLLNLASDKDLITKRFTVEK